MSEDRGTLRTVAWNELFPWLILVRALRLAFSPSLLTLAILAAILVPIGWHAATIFVTEADRDDAGFRRVQDATRAWPGAHDDAVLLRGGGLDVAPWEVGQNGLHALSGTFWSMTLPAGALFSREMSITRLAYLVAGNLWSLAVWAFLGGMLTRIAMVRLACEERVGLVEAARFVGRRYRSYVAAPLFPFLMVLLFAICGTLLGWLMRLDAGLILAGIVWGVFLLFSTAVAVALGGLLFGWPLMWATLSAEEVGDMFEAAQRSYSYTFGRPLRYGFYVAVAAVLGAAGWILVFYATEGVIRLAAWGAAWGASNVRLDEIAILDANPAAQASSAMRVGRFLLGLWEGLVRTMAAGFRYSYLWTAACAIYLLLRRDVDETEMDEVFLDESQERFGLPPLEVDEAGVPGVAETESTPHVPPATDG